ncbi:MAG: DUF2299 family protein [Promethearchaeota archaeon]
MSTKESKIKNLIREYLLDEGLLREQINDSKLDFGFQFVFPPIKDQSGRELGRKMIVIQPKNKDFIIITLVIQISKPQIDALNSLKENRRNKFFMNLRKYFLVNDLFYRLDFNYYRYQISDQIFQKEDGTISKNTFFKSIRHVFDAAAYSNLVLGEYCMDKIKPDDIMKSKDFTPDSDFSLYS